MNQRYRDDEDYRRRMNNDDIDRRYAQPHPDSRFEGERSQSQWSQNRSRTPRDENYGSRSYDDRDRGQRDYGSFGSSSARDDSGEWRDRSRQSDYSRGGWSDRDRYPGGDDRRGEHSRFDEPFGAHLLSKGNAYSGTAGGFGSSRDFAQQGSVPFGSRGGYDSSAGQFEGYGSGNVGGRYYGQQTLDSRGGASNRGRAQRGEHFGKGPKGYRRSDDRIREDVCDRLAQDDEVDASEIVVTTSNGEVTLEGAVPDRYTKHRAEDIVDSVSGVIDIHNRLKVDKGFLQELGDKVMGNENKHSGNAGARPMENKNGVSAGSR